MKNDTIFWLLLGGVLAYFLYDRYASNKPLIWSEVGNGTQGPGIVGSIQEVFQPGLENMDAATIKKRASFLTVIRTAEGTEQYDNPYSVIFGGLTLDPPDFSDHPGNLGFVSWQHFTNPQTGHDDYSTASGAYQITLATWNRIKSKLGLPDFGPASQDEAALELIREKGALSNVDNGDVTEAIQKVNTIWASLPGSPYGQPTQDLAFLQDVYTRAVTA